jgi:hypothetical protein
MMIEELLQRHIVLSSLSEETEYAETTVSE